MNFKLWWTLNAFWAIVFVTVFIYIMVRKMTITGPVQVYQMRMVALAIEGYFLGIIGVAQVLLYHYIKSKSKHDKKND
ncbi:DUF3923 family protein [Companilactobacillus versmoldensis]|uniref:Uncharacterized protein n=1 Tax=Companilactobacillus versmoldensis DSM 14857 = KCTC 3814 TaxID=1423815 RepID=A0A0R1SC04_9LACO|nr:DUF3923 family protein [Companilactobacillus versmoldensis]KRL67094.1 hypothetical protein FC27_GL002215 [Companilactobacillus versmoldensis DSM 14857 = KCTC 3814]